MADNGGNIMQCSKVKINAKNLNLEVFFNMLNHTSKCKDCPVIILLKQLIDNNERQKTKDSPKDNGVF